MLPRITDILANHFAEAIFRLDLEGAGKYSDVAWDAIIIPGPDGAPLGWFVLEIPSAVLGSRLRASGIIQNPSALTIDSAMDTVRSALEALERQQSEQLKDGSSTVIPGVVAGQSGAVLL